MSSIADEPRDCVNLIEIDQSRLQQHIVGEIGDAIVETLNALLDAEAGADARYDSQQ